MNLKENDNKCSKYAVIVALNCQNIENNPPKKSKIKCFIGQKV